MEIKFVALLFGFIISATKCTKVHAIPNISICPKLTDSSNEEVWHHDVRILKRYEWLAQPPSEPPEKLNLPVEYVFISHTNTEGCDNQALCILRARMIQTFHMLSKNWADIGYNFLVGGDGNAYEGRSWDNVGAHTFNYNNISIGISFIGTFNAFIPPKTQIYAAQKLIEKGVELGKISKNYSLLGHRQVIKTESPGDALYAVMKEWPQWSPNP